MFSKLVHQKAKSYVYPLIPLYSGKAEQELYFIVNKFKLQGTFRKIS